MKKERVKLLTKKQDHLVAVMVKSDQFRLVLPNKYAALEQEDEANIELINETATRLLSEAAVEVGGKVTRETVGELSQVTKDLIKKRQRMKMSNSRDQIEFAELSKLINKQKVRDIRNYNVGQIKVAVKDGRSTKSVRRQLGIGQGKMYALKDKQGSVISNFDDIVKAVEEFCSDLYSTEAGQAEFIGSIDEEDTEGPSITSDEIKMALEAMTRGKAAEEDGITVALIIDRGDTMLEELAALCTQCLTTSSIPESGKNANIILIDKKGEGREKRGIR